MEKFNNKKFFHNILMTLRIKESRLDFSATMAEYLEPPSAHPPTATWNLT